MGCNESCWPSLGRLGYSWYVKPSHTSQMNWDCHEIWTWRWAWLINIWGFLFGYFCYECKFLRENDSSSTLDGFRSLLALQPFWSLAALCMLACIGLYVAQFVLSELWHPIKSSAPIILQPVVLVKMVAFVVRATTDSREEEYVFIGREVMK